MRDPIAHRVVLVVGATLLCILGQALWWARSQPAADAAFLLRSHPSGASVYRYVAQANDPWVYLGTTPGPRLRDRDLPCSLKVELWGMMPRAVRVTQSDLATRTTGGLTVKTYPPDGPLKLTPRVPFLVPLIYFLRDWPWACAAVLGWALVAVRATTLHARLKRGWRLRRRLEAGQLHAGVELGGYLLEREIARGGMGRVFLARRQNEPSGEALAVKVLFDDEGAWSTWTLAMREADVCRRLMHANIVPLLDWGEEAMFVYIVMEHVPGETLRQRLERGTLTSAEAARVGLQVSEGLLYAHQNKVVHCDIKPANLMTTPAGTVKILDFGIARAAHVEPLDETGPIAGTPAYVAPETIERRADWRADYYSLGVTLFETLAGHLPFRADSTHETLRCHLSMAAPLLVDLRPDLDPELCALVQQLLEKNPARRVGAMSEVRQRFADLVSRLE